MSRLLKVYVASSWRNLRQLAVVEAIRKAGHEVYDFRNPAPGGKGFGWAQVSRDPPKGWSPRYYRDGVLQHGVAQAGFRADMDALRGADATVLVLPCGRSAHLELGYATGAGQRTYVLLDSTIDEPELMYLMNTQICLSLEEVLEHLEASP